MIEKANVPSLCLPTEMDTENALRVSYKTNLLFPTLGPLQVSRLVTSVSRVIEDLAVADVLMEKIKQFKDKNGRTPSIPTSPEPTDPYIVDVHSFEYVFVRPIKEVLQRENVLATNISSYDMRRPAAQHTVMNSRKMLKKHSVVENQVNLNETALLGALAAPNRIIRKLFNKGLLINSEDQIGDAKILNSKLPHVAIISCIAPESPLLEKKHSATFESLVKLSVKRVDKITGKSYLSDFESKPEFRKSLCNFTFDLLQKNKFFKTFDWFLTGNDGVSSDREWAYQRSETLALGLGQPVLRGPVNAYAVSPKSKLTLSEHESKSLIEEFSKSASKGVRSASSQVEISSDTFRQALDNLSEHGISDETSFAQESTLLSTLNEEKRAIINTISREISSKAQSSYATSNLTATSRSSEYSTEGKDAHLATTELKFQVVVPVHAKVMLEDIGLVWSPRVSSPFMLLHAGINAYETEQKNEYLAQSYAPMPVKPAIKCDTTIVTFEVQIDGSSNINTKDFTRVFEYTDDNTYIDLDGITATHRNGTSSDFNWNERWNWDDLEHAIARVESLGLSADGHTLTGRAVLETYDPELLNRSFITINVPLKTYTDETQAAMQAYENALTEQTQRTAAIQARAAQYARMKRDELIESYQESIALKKEAFRSLIRRVFVDSAPEEISYFEELISRCINWDESVITFESQRMDQLPFRHLAPDHFMNCPGIRFFLPIYKSAEKNFFDAFASGGMTYHENSAQKVRDYLVDYRGKISDWKQNNPTKLVMDEFDTEIIIGHHLEAMMSTFDFSS